MAETYTPNYNWTKPSLGGDANTWGSVLNGTIDKIDAQVWSLNAQATTNTMTVMRGADNTTDGIVSFNSNAATVAASRPRWYLYESAETESGGGNTGSNFGLNAYDNTGAYLGNVFTVARATQTMTFNAPVITGGTLTANGGVTINGILTANNAVTFSSSITAASAIISGAGTINGVLTVNNNANITGSIICSGGTTGGGWTVGGTCQVNGNLWGMGNVYVAYTATSGQYLLNADSSGRYIHYAPSWYWTWATSGGLLFWSTPGGTGGTEWAPFQIDGAGNVSYAGALIHISDAAAKENIAPFKGDPLAIVAGIPLKLYNLLGKTERHLGFIAQDVQAVMPEAVLPTKDDVLGVDQNRLVAVLWSAVQKLTERVQELESRLAP